MDILSLKEKLLLIMLIRRGLRVGKKVYIHPDAHIDGVNAHLIEIGDECTISDGVKILAHDASTKRHIGVTKTGRVIIGRKTFIGVGSVILPNVTIGSNVIIGAGSVVTHDIPSNSVAYGNPAIIVSKTSDFVLKQKDLLVKFPERYRR